jgi:D-aminoacyl-tRNA deacylase
MIAFLQRVSSASVHVDTEQVAGIDAGLMVLLCAEREDTLAEVEQLLNKLVNYRVFSDEEGKMNVSLRQLAELRVLKPVVGNVGLLLVPQFTLAADTQSGTRPSFTPAAPPELGRRLFDYFVAQAKALNIPSLSIETGVFGANMQVALVNDGPVSFWLQTRKSATSRTMPALN